MEEYILVYIVAVWAVSAMVAGALFAYSLVTRPHLAQPQLVSPEGAKLHFWYSELEMAAAKRAMKGKGTGTQEEIFHDAA